ncbi:MAG: ubiquinone/menaquinone biosynthesis methyltransferase [Thermodesulfobacteriota bacterium]|nr:ubiquinone/menaquinone biosynthesis methyltransferase [Thermodesulfobacteriota bacterium]
MEKGINKKYPSINQVTDSERIGMVKDIFTTITGRYDFLNHFLSLRRDIAWRRFAVHKMRFFETYRFLDVATGTSDLAIEAALNHPEIHITGLDFVEKMMELGMKKIEKNDLSSRIHMLMGDALYIPTPSDSFDVVGIAFGIRNIPDKARALKEMVRVTVPGGQVMVLEMTTPGSRFLRGIYRIYLEKLLPFLARIFTPNPKAYYYLGDSIINFPHPRDFLNLMEQSGCVDVEMHPLTLGITYLHIGYKPRTK